MRNNVKKEAEQWTGNEAVDMGLVFRGKENKKAQV